MNEKQKRILEILAVLKSVGFGSADLLDFVDDVLEESVKDYESAGYDFEFFKTEEDKARYIVSEQEKITAMMAVHNEYFDFSNKDGLLYQTKAEFEELFKQLQTEALNTEELYKLYSVAKEMTFYQMLKNTLDLVISAGLHNIEMIKAADLESNLGRFVAPACFNEIFRDFSKGDKSGFDDEKLDEFLDELLAGDEKVEGDVVSLYEHFDKLDQEYSDKINEFDSQIALERHNVWGEFSACLKTTIYEKQKENMNKNIADFKKYRVGCYEQGNVIYKIGDEEYKISEEHLIDDVVKFSRALQTYEKEDKQKVSFEPIEPEVIEPKEVALENGLTQDELETQPEIAVPDNTSVESEVVEVDAQDEAKDTNFYINAYVDFVLAHPGYEGVKREDVVKIVEANPERLEKFAEALENGMITIPEKTKAVSNEPLESASVEAIDEPIVEEVSFEENPIDISGIDKYGYVADPTTISNDDSQFGDYASIPDGYSIPDMEEHRRGAR